MEKIEKIKKIYKDSNRLVVDMDIKEVDENEFEGTVTTEAWCGRRTHSFEARIYNGRLYTCSKDDFNRWEHEYDWE